MFDKNYSDHNSYYTDQVGGKLAIEYYRGEPYQRGRGKFSYLARRYGIPVIKYLMKQGIDLGKDAFKGFKKGFKQNVESKAEEIGKNIFQKGSGLRRQIRQTQKFTKKSKRNKPKKIKTKKNEPKKKTEKKVKRSSNVSKYDIFNKY